MEHISVWVTIEDYYKYLKGIVVIGESARRKNYNINLHVPLKNVFWIGESKVGRKKVVDIEIVRSE
uniref:Uncharacterized protein n=1 Tax=Bacillus phage Adastra TaxID=3143958 RepID=A0AAU8BE99_9CAUD